MTEQQHLSAGHTARAASWRTRSGELAVDRPLVFGILNVTPDSFSDGGRFQSPSAALAQAERMVAEGADGVDIGGESTRPQNARAVAASEEIERVVPVVRAVRRRFQRLPISVDTTKSDVLRAALAEGADIVNDVSGFRIDPRIGEIAAAERAGVVLMHSRGSVEEMGTYRHADYGGDVVGEILGELGDALRRAEAAGVAREYVVLDPGIGFAKRTEHSLRVLAELGRLMSLGCPIMVGVSRKRFIGELSGVMEPQHRVAGTVGANVVALMRGARVFRVHDVAPNRQALDVAWGVVRAAGEWR
jgi:dihydropteroate synthase